MGRSNGRRRAGARCAALVFFCIATVAGFCSAAEPSDASAEKPPAELAALQRFVGDWETTAILRRPGPPAREVVTKGKASCRATLGGRCFEFRTGTIPPGDSDLQVMTFDASASLYRQWVFSSDGYRHEATGVWNAKANTMTWTGKSDEGVFVIEDRWTSADRLEWNLVRKDAAGKVVQTITGVVTRAKEE